MSKKTSLWLIAALMSSVPYAYAGRPSSPAQQQPAPANTPNTNPSSPTPGTTPQSSDNNNSADQNNAAQQPGFLSTTEGQAAVVVGSAAATGLTTFGIYQGIKRMNSSNHQKTPTVLETRRNPQPGGTGTLSNPQGQGQPPVKVVGAPQGQPKVVEAPQVKVVEAPQVKVVEAPQVKVVEAPQPKPKDAQELLNDVETETETIKPTKKASQKEKNEDFAELMDESKLKMPQKTETTGSGAQPKPGVKATVNPQPNPTTTGSWETQLDKKTHELMKTQEQLNPTKMEATTGPGGGAPKPQSATAKEMEMEMETATAVKTVTTHPSATTPGPGPGSTTETHANSKGWSYIPFSGLLRDAQTLWRGEDASTKTDSKPHDHSANPAHTSTSHSEHKNSTHVVHDV